MAGSAADAISQAVERSKQLLFPVKMEKWFALGFTVFLAQCGEGASVNMPTNFGGSTPRPGLPSGSASSEFQKTFEEALRAFSADAALYVSLAAAALLLALGIWVFVIWFSSRAKLMFVESVIWDRVDVGAQWTRAGELGFSLFKFRTLLAGGGALLMLLAIGAGFFTALPDFRAGLLLGSRALIGYGLFGSAVIFLGFPLLVVSLLLDDFVVPLMVVRNARVSEAWRLCRSEVLSGRVGGAILFYVLRLVLGMGVAMLTVIATCITCCLTAIPYVGTVLLLPIFVFYRAYPLYYMEQIGIAIFPQPEPAWAKYDEWRFPQ
ncbi:MAG TPA: hypothetical protein VEQ58_10285 [Polyangiaceae bacterium]|nr:hypothetical protein [Polyangiaceae bacterium]